MRLSPLVSPRDIAERAYELLRDGEWLRGTAGGFDAEGKFHGCLSGAILWASGGVGQKKEVAIMELRAAEDVLSAVRRVLDERAGLPHVAYWNDRVCNDGEEALDVLKETIVNLPLEDSRGT